MTRKVSSETLIFVTDNSSPAFTDIICFISHQVQGQLSEPVTADKKTSKLICGEEMGNLSASLWIVCVLLHNRASWCKQNIPVSLTGPDLNGRRDGAEVSYGRYHEGLSCGRRSERGEKQVMQNRELY